LTRPGRVPDKGDVPTGDEGEPDVHLTILDRLDGPPSAPVAALRAVRAGLVRLAGWLAAASAFATLARRALLPAACALAGVALAVVVAFGWFDSPPARSAIRTRPVAAVPTPPSPSAPPADRLADASAVLGDPAVPEDRKLAVVDDVAKDPREVATDVLLSAGRNDSELVAMASIRALRGRPCERIVASLASRLAHDDWRQRAWAAKVLGENACAAAVPDLRRRLASERDARVRRQLSAALSALASG
jgi:HEAT repeat protein